MAGELYGGTGITHNHANSPAAGNYAHTSGRNPSDNPIAGNHLYTIAYSNKHPFSTC
jgi:hypothetical protein